MAVAARDPKLEEYGALFCDRSRRVSELELRRILKELDALIERAQDRYLAAWLYELRAMGYTRLGQPTRSLNDLRLALQRLREPSAERARVLCNQAWTLLELGRYREAAMSSLEASRHPSGYTYVNLANLAEALQRLGEPEAALQTFQEALGLADLSNPSHCFMMAHQAALLGLDQDAVELFARFVVRRRGVEHDDRPAMDIARGASEEEKAGLANVPVLDATLRRLTAMADELARLASRAGVESDDVSSSDADDVYEATRLLRAEALAHALPT